MGTGGTKFLARSKGAVTAEVESGAVTAVVPEGGTTVKALAAYTSATVGTRGIPNWILIPLHMSYVRAREVKTFLIIFIFYYVLAN